MLKISNLNSFYGKAQVLKGVHLNIRPGQIVALLGPNGAGKTTTMMSISGLCSLSEASSILFQDEEISKLKSDAIVKRGIVHVPQGRGVFPGLTVRENLIMGAYFNKSKKRMDADMEEALELFPRLKERRKQQAGTLSGGEQQMLAIMRGLMAKPRLLMLDEPSMGLAPIIVEQIYETIGNINRGGTTIFLVEQNTNMALQAADYAYVLSSGVIVNQGDAALLRQDEDMLKSYFQGHDVKQ
ncbi:MAG: ABC transporter ATP-binding protein [Christensenellales bacterium]|jgi:branched-chain amino acid transport system ATP-binding protein